MLWKKKKVCKYNVNDKLPRNKICSAHIIYSPMHVIYVYDEKWCVTESGINGNSVGKKTQSKYSFHHHWGNVLSFAERCICLFIWIIIIIIIHAYLQQFCCCFVLFLSKSSLFAFYRYKLCNVCVLCTNVMFSIVTISFMLNLQYKNENSKRRKTSTECKQFQSDDRQRFNVEWYSFRLL